MSDEPIRQPGESILSFAKRRVAWLDGDVPLPAANPLSPSTQTTQEQTWDPELIPEFCEYDRSPQEYEIDAELAKVDILKAYSMWCGKMEPDVGSKRESIMVSCPNPSHPDANPSAWINLDEGPGGVGNCPVCGGFDKFIIAAWKYGLDYESDFRELRHQMAEDLGYTVVMSGKEAWLVRDQPEYDEGETPDSAEAVSPSLLTAEVQIPSAVSEIIPEIDAGEVKFNWRLLPALKDDSFLRTWMTLTSSSYEPEEFHFWLGLQACAAAVGNQVVYADSPPVRPNLMCCMTGPTGHGKTIAIGFFEKLIRAALPYRRDVPGGVLMVSSPGSGEALVDSFNNVLVDPTTKEKTIIPVNGIYRENELATFVKRAKKDANTIREQVMDFYDNTTPVSTKSRTHGEVEATDHFMQMTTSTQPKSLSKLLTESDAAAGFLNRWVFIYGAGKVRPSRLFETIHIHPAVAPLQAIRAWASTKREVRFSDPTAIDLWDKFYYGAIQERDKDNDILARMDLLAKKLILLFAINDRSTSVLVEHVQSVILLWPYLLKCYNLIEQEVGIDALEQCCVAVEKYFRERPNSIITGRILKKQSGARKFNLDMIKRSLEVLTAAGIISDTHVKGERYPKYTYIKESHSEPLASVTQLFRQ